MNLLRHKSKLAGFCCLLLLISSLPAYAANDEKDQWQFQLAPYGWLAGQNGTVGTLPGLPPVDIDMDFWDDVLGNIDGALFLVGEARKDRWGAYMDVAYVDIKFEEDTPSPYFSSFSSRTESWIVSVAGFYRLFEEAGTFLDLTAGVRYWNVNSTLSLGSGVLSGQEISNSEDWLDPKIGVKGMYPLGASRFYLSGGLSVGGFGVGSDFMWDLSANLGYRWTETFATIFGYRYLDVDYEKDGFLYDIAQQGPVLGLSWRF